MKRMPLNPAPLPVDLINHPPHYTQGDIECIDAIKAALGQGGFECFLRGQIIKYTWRLGLKGDGFDDAQKAEWYLRRLNEELMP